MNSKHVLSSLAVLVAALAANGAQAQIVNGSFETGNLTGWTTGVNNRVAVVQNSNFRVGSNPAPMPAVPDGNYFAVLSTGPGAISGSGSTIDGNASNDFDSSTLNGTISFSGRPAVLMFDWSFASSEPDASPPYDDIFDVRINNLRVFSGSVSGATNNTSDFPNAPATGLGVVNWSINTGVVSGTALSRGVGAWTRTCITVPYATTGSYNLPLIFRVADQADNTVDSVLLIDNVRVQEACDPNPGVALSQFTNTSGTNVEAKGGGFVYRQADQRLVVANRDGSSTQVRAFISSANNDGSNPNLIEQVYLRRNGANERVDLALAAGGRIQALDLSDEGGFLAFSARESATDNLEIYRVRLSNGLLTKLTNTGGCSNENPVVSSGGSVLAFESTCAALTGYGTTRKIVYMRLNNAGVISSTVAIPAINGCTAQDPSITTNGQFIGMTSTCNPPGRSNGNGYRELFVYQNVNDQPTSSSRWRQVTSTSASALNYGLSLGQGGNGFTNVYANFISTANLASNNSEGLPEIFRWRGNNTTGNNGTLAQITNGPVAGADYYYTYVQRAITNSDTAYYSFERINGLTGGIEVGFGLSSSLTPTVMAAGGNFLGLSFTETNTEVIVPFVAAEDFTGGNGDGNYEVWEARATK